MKEMNGLQKKKRLEPGNLSVKYLNFISSNNRKPFSIVCYEHKTYTTLYVVVDSEEFDK